MDADEMLEVAKKVRLEEAEKNVAGVARMVAAYYAALLTADVPQELAALLTQQYNILLWHNIHTTYARA